MTWYISALLYVWELFKLWLHTIFVTPFQTMDMLWILVPVWLAWFFAEFFQEKIGTSMGNAISNSVVVLWGSIDCTRQTVNLLTAGIISGFGNIAARFLIITLLFAYGIFIIVMGIKGNKIIKHVGRIREVTYFFAIFVPIFYNVIPFSWDHIIAAIIFFPLFYYAIELIDKLTPDPKAIREDEEDSKQGGTSGTSSSKDESSGIGSDKDFNLDDLK